MGMFIPAIIGAVGAGIGAMAMRGGQSAPPAPAAPAPITPAAQPSAPTTKSGKGAGPGMQQSFLSGAAGAGLPGGQTGYAQTGDTVQKTLLGS